MSGPQNGKYLIQVAPPKFFVGADFGPGPVVPVITEGSDNVWTVERLEDGNYHLSLGGGLGRPYARADDGKVVVGGRPPSPWFIRKLDDGLYTIEVPGFRPTRAWTVNDPIVPKSPVILDFLFDPLPGQKWTFIPLPVPQ